MRGPETLSTYIRNATVTTTVARAHALIAIERRFFALIENPLLPAHCRLANLRDTVLVLETDSPAWATRLRYSAPEMVHRLAAGDFPPVSEIRIRVRPPEAPTETTRRATLSAESAAHLRSAAAAISDAPLAAALRRLAERAVNR
jgi:hypothetical protein